ncbi:hypothetical protein IEO21_00702 [Rhodonia placenta]|uniref:Uncharacterized protein n=1 Tax=Rhodonia placenta TaxID=104341 RepID=A0A8H7PB37_9APHY|nr:hypothetical protein IEO21_00702 [Postia placenta]
MPEAQSRRNVLSLRSATFGSCRRVGTHKLLCSTCFSTIQPAHRV